MSSTNSATSFEDPMDPTETMDFVGEFGLLLETAETIVTGFTVIPSAESTALGFEISASTPPSLEAGEKNIVFWCEVNVVNQADAVWCDEGVRIEVEITFDTTIAPRHFQRRFIINVKQL